MVAVILPDGGRSYLSKVFNDAWMTEHGFLERADEQTVGDVLQRKHDDRLPALVSVRSDQPVREAVALLHEHRVSQLPVVSAHDADTRRRLDRRARAAHARRRRRGRARRRRSSTSWSRRSPPSRRPPGARGRRAAVGRPQALLVTP